MQHGNVNISKEPITVYAVLVGEVGYFIKNMNNPEEKNADFSPFEADATPTAVAKTQLLFDLKNRSPQMEIPVFENEKLAFYQARQVYPAHAFTICELQIPADKYKPGANLFNNKNIASITPEMLSHVTLLTGYGGKDKEYHHGKSFTVQKTKSNTVEFLPADHKIIHVKPK